MPIRRMQSQELPSTAPAADNGDTQFLSKFTQIYADNVVLPPEGQPLYKDECVFTFETAESENGVYICLKRHFAISREALQDYIGFSQQNIFLHHRRTKRFLPDNTPKDENGQSKPKRMAIGVEGGFNPDGPAFEYEDHYTVALFPENAEIDYDITKLPTQLVSAIERIISAGSASRVVEATAQNATWDGEFRVISKHAENLLQLDNGKKVPASGWVCETEGCGITEGLWLNLTDGSIACGRKMWDGSGGNNHAKEHFDNTGYPLVVKLGTISADGGDVYSYAEDDMVLDPKLDEHLRRWGIDLAGMKKTEKTMAELEIEWNQKVGDFSKLTESDKKLQSAYGPELTGMENLGNSCYMNSIVQVFFSFDAFIDKYYRNYKSNVFNKAMLTKKPAEDFTTQFSKLAYGLLSGKYSIAPADDVPEDNRKGIRPIMIKNVIGRDHIDFSTKQQQDAYEFFVHLLSVIERDSIHDESSPADYFKFKQEIRMTDAESGFVRLIEREDNSLSLSIPVEDAINATEIAAAISAAESTGGTADEDSTRPIVPIEALIRKLAEEEFVDDVYSTVLKRKTMYIKTTRFLTFPKYLLIRLERFVVSGNDWAAVPKKLMASVLMPDELDLHEGPLSLKAIGLGEDQLMPEETDEDRANLARLNEESKKKAEDSSIDWTIVTALRDMGFDDGKCRQAVLATNNRGVEVAAQWILENPGAVPGPSANAAAPTAATSAQPAASDGSVQQVMELGFTRAQAIYALGKTSQNVERAVDWIFNHMDEVSTVTEESLAAAAAAQSAPPTVSPQPPVSRGEQALQFASPSNGRYRLKAFISHMGPSTGSGHYVCHIKKKDRWLIYNDEKVAFSESPPRDLAYLYFYERDD